MKARRHFAIIDIISNQRITTQEELCEALRKNGFDVTQATVSRDIKELQLVKIPDKEGYRYALPAPAPLIASQERMKRAFADAVVNIDYSGNIVVVKTLPGAAQSIASIIDNYDNPRILGTVGGDDTVFVVVKPEKAAEEIAAEFRSFIMPV
ncbi:transcriptional regulator, ArgR family [Thermosyntropha lipolytica DSM 11003]|uniref:Arginine repressor n=1 Tax=Thermosyntropha lipolytica DSM 11003 TaxID=1123382 RepID=A0A1M5LHN8_9FIRM|nr:arginine repressor [Thermosyntropha lipolytica]SHG64652.1 transcriptional regulator, ArgR family [Thermosyntropha lipolytica DSM 11003]